MAISASIRIKTPTDPNTITLQVCNQYRKILADVHYREEENLYQLQHRANAEKSVVEFDTKIGQKRVDDPDHQNKRRRREANPLEKHLITIMSK
ncbi:6446_t:CDS:2, partial [Acaulospora morrowiae]